MISLAPGLCGVLFPLAAGLFRPMATHQGSSRPVEEEMVQFMYGPDAGSIVPAGEDSVRLVSQQVNVYDRFHLGVQWPPGHEIPIDYADFAAGDVAGVDSLPGVLPAWKIAFGPHARNTFIVQYDASWTVVSGNPGHRLYAFTHHARLAAAWAGPVEETEVSFHLGDVAIGLLTAAGCGQFSPFLHPRPADGRGKTMRSPGVATTGNPPRISSS